MTEESVYCREVMTKHFNKELVMTKKDNEDLMNFTKSWICYNTNVDDDVKVRDHCHINEKYRGSVRRDWNINVNFNKTGLSESSFFWGELIRPQLYISGRTNLISIQLYSELLSNLFKVG